MTEMTGAPGEKIARTTFVAPDVGPPGRLDMRRAFDIYVFGRNRTMSPEEKGRVVGGTAEVPFAVPPAEVRASAPAIRGPAVPVPSELRYERNAGTWRHSGVASKE